jgi:glycogen synthase
MGLLGHVSAEAALHNSVAIEIAVRIAFFIVPSRFEAFGFS